jgi:hypothetical protein
MVCRILAVLLLNSCLAYSQASNGKAGIFSTKVMPSLKALILALAPTAKISEGRDGDSTNLTCQWSDVTVRLTIKPHWDGRVERDGMKNWISGFPAEDKNNPAVISLLHRIDSTVDCVGSVTTPRYDSAGKAASLILGLAASLDGYVFSKLSFYDLAGARIIGVSGAPLNLKDQN